MKVLREPVELGKLRYAQQRSGFVRRWLFLSLLYALMVLVSMWAISLRRPVDARSMLGGVVGMMIVVGIMEGIKLLAARYKLAVWKWDAERLCNRGFCTRWSDLYQFKVKSDYPAPGFAGFFVQHRTWGQRPGVWAKIISYKGEVDVIAEAARRYLPQQPDRPDVA